MSKNDQISLSFVEAAIYSPAVAKGSICRETKVFPAECRGRRCSYKGKLVVRPCHFQIFVFFFTVFKETMTGTVTSTLDQLVYIYYNLYSLVAGRHQLGD